MRKLFELMDNSNQLIVGIVIILVFTALYKIVNWILGDSKSNYDKYFDNY